MEMVLYFLVYCMLFALPALIPRVNHYSKKDKQGRIAVIRSLGIASLGITFLNVTYLSASFDPLFRLLHWENQLVDIPTSSELTMELWVRNILPPPFSDYCYINKMACDFIDYYYQNPDYPGLPAEINWWGGYLLSIGVSFISGFVSAFFVWVFTRTTSKYEPDET